MTVPAHNRRHTLFAIAYGAVLLAWLTPEDTTLVIVSALGTGLSALLVSLAVMRWLGGQTLAPQQWVPGLIALGTGIGFGAVWCTIGLMVFKNAWHSHAYPDFSATIVVGIANRAVLWSIAGGLCGLAAALWQSARAS